MHLLLNSLKLNAKGTPILRKTRIEHLQTNSRSPYAREARIARNEDDFATVKRQARPNFELRMIKDENKQRGRE